MAALARVGRFEVAAAPANQAKLVQRTGTTGFCNSCWHCDWTV